MRMGGRTGLTLNPLVGSATVMLHYGTQWNAPSTLMSAYILSPK